MNLSEIIDLFGLEIGNLDNVPDCPGVYLLFTEKGLVIYVGKATSLKKRISNHFSSNEQNISLRLWAKYFVWNVTDSVSAAEKLEGEIYDKIFENSGFPPIGNINAPPTSKLCNSSQANEKYRKYAEVISRLLTKAKGGEPPRVHS